MAKPNRRAGKNIRNLALKRRTQAVLSFASAGLIVLMPIFLGSAFNQIVKELPIPAESAQAPTPAIQFPAYLYLFFVVIALAPIANGLYLLKRAKHADQGAQGEEDIAQTLQVLEREGWRFDYNLPLKGRLSDADIVCMSPKGQSYVIDVKSHRGEVFTDGQQLQKRFGGSTYPFEKDFLKRAMAQALQVKEQQNYSFVTPIVAFSNAKVSVPPGKLRGVYVVEKAKLVALLKSLG